MEVALIWRVQYTLDFQVKNIQNRSSDCDAIWHDDKLRQGLFDNDDNNDIPPPPTAATPPSVAAQQEHDTVALL